METSALNTVHFETLGCKLNQVESEGIAKSFSDLSFCVDFEPMTAASDERADVVLCVVNTCTVTAKAEQKARRIIRLLLKKCPRSLVIVTGCYAQVSADEIKSIDSRVFVLGGQKKSALSKIPALVSDISEKEKISSILKGFFDDLEKNPDGKILEPFALSTSSFFNHSRASLKIQDGCNARCTYCKIQIARGSSVSLLASEAISRLRSLEKAGYAEAVITTVNISQYHSFVKNADGTKIPVNFTDLLKMMLESTEKISIRISSLYPEIVDERFAKIAENPRVRPHFHISVQSGSDAILEKMKRPYRIDAVKNAVSLLKKAKGDPFLACDIIAGFPGETDADFDLTMKMLEECGFTFVHAFPFSARPGTEAFSMRPCVPSNVAKNRVERLEEFSARQKKSYIERFVGKEIEAVAESWHRAKVYRDRVIVHAVTENFLHCQILLKNGERVPEAGKTVRVKIERPLLLSEKTGESDTKAVLL